jgi:nucleoside triphosphate diphosphatase
MTPSREIQRLIEVMAALRNPQDGCPWDKEQTFSSIAPYTIEEAYEVADAISRDDMDDLRDELGDLLLQVAYHARIAEEADAFDFGDVVHSITDKMIRRHPHVFGDAEARKRGMTDRLWDEVKAQEKAAKVARRQAEGIAEPAMGLLDDVPRTLPSLMEAWKLQRRASGLGFDWPDRAPVLGKLKEETSEFEAEMAGGDADRLSDEIGDLLFTVVNLARHVGVDPDAALSGTNRKFRRRFDHMEAGARADGGLSGKSTAELETLWQAAKATE